MIDQDKVIKGLIRTALDDAFRLQVGHLYKTWLTNPGEMDAARIRAAKGLDTAIAAYRVAIDALETWEG
jgi:hypothetical protein